MLNVKLLSYLIVAVILSIISQAQLPQVNFTNSTPINNTLFLQRNYSFFNITPSQPYDSLVLSYNNTNLTLDDPNLLFYASFTDGNFNDTSRYSHNVTVNNGVICNIAGKYGEGCQFNKTIESYLNFSYASDLELSSTPNWSVSIWLYPQSPALPAYLLDTRSGKTGFSIRLGANGVEAFFNSSTTHYCLPTVKVHSGEWQHLVVVKTATRMSCYLNGTLAGSTATSNNITLSNLNLLVGNVQSRSQGYNGSIDDIRIYNRSLSASEILGLYRYELGRNFANITQGQGSSTYYAWVNDSSGNQNQSGERIVAYGWTTTITMNLTTGAGLQDVFCNATPIAGELSALNYQWWINSSLFNFNTSVLGKNNLTTSSNLTCQINMTDGIVREYHNSSTYSFGDTTAPQVGMAWFDEGNYTQNDIANVSLNCTDANAIQSAQVYLYSFIDSGGTFNSNMTLTLNTPPTYSQNRQMIATGQTGILGAWCIDGSGNIGSNFNLTNVTVSETVTPSAADSSGGGGGVITVSNGTGRFELKTTVQSDSYSFFSYSGQTKTIKIYVSNKDAEQSRIEFMCQSDSKICNYVSFQNNSILLPPNSDYQAVLPVLLKLPSDIEKGTYYFSVVGTDKYGKQSLPITLTVGNPLGIVNLLIDKLSSRYSFIVNQQTVSIPKIVPFIILSFVELFLIFGIIPFTKASILPKIILMTLSLIVYMGLWVIL